MSERPRHCLCLIALLLLALFVSCQKQENRSLILLYTGNIHGVILPYDFIKDTTMNESLANASSFIHDVRDIYGPDNVLTVDVGGTMTGHIEAFYANFVDTVSEPIYYRAERLIGYDAIGIVQRDLDVAECLEPRRRASDYDRPLLCANILDSRTGKPYFKPYSIFKRAGLKVAVLGLTSPEISVWIPKSEWRYIQTQDMVECAQQWVPYIQKHEHPDILIGLFGSSRNYESKQKNLELDTYKNPNGGIPVAQRVPGFDLVILSDDKEAQIFDLVNDAGEDVRIVNVGVRAKNIGFALINVVRRKDGTYAKRILTNNFYSSRYDADTAFVKAFEADQKAIAAWMNQKLSFVPSPILPQIGICGPTPYRSIIHNAQLWYTGADISLTSILTDVEVIPPGPFLTKDLINFYRFENSLLTIQMTGEELHRLMEYTYGQQINQMKGPDDLLLALQHDPFGYVARNREGHPYLKIPPSSYISAAGLHYVVDASKPVGERVSIGLMRNGEPFDIHKTYTVAINSFHGSGGDDLLTKGIGWNLETLQMRTMASHPVNMRHVLSQYLQQVDTIPVDYEHTEWHLEPTEWVLRARAKGRQEPSPIW